MKILLALHMLEVSYYSNNVVSYPKETAGSKKLLNTYRECVMEY